MASAPDLSSWWTPTPRRRPRSRYAAAISDSRLIGDWAPLNQSVNDLIAAASPRVRARVRQLCRDFPYFRRAVRLVVNYAVGDGIIFQARVAEPGTGKLLTRYNQQIEDAFNFWAEDADVAGRLHYYELMALSKRQDLECGEFLLVKTRPRRKTRSGIPFALQAYEVEWLDSGVTSHGSNPVHQGIEYDRATGEVLAYHLTDPDGWGKSVRVPAGSVIHRFETERPGQLRGISPLVSAVLMAHSLGEYLTAELDRAKMAAKYLGTLTTPEGPDYGATLGPGESEDNDLQQRRIDLENAIIEVLRPGEKLDLTGNPNPNPNHPEYVRGLLCMLAVTAEVPYELLSGDYTGFNYSTGRISRNDFAQQLKPVCTRIVRHFGLPTLRPWFEAAVLSGALRLPDYFSRPRFWERHVWQPPGMESIDPGRETKAMINQVKALLRSPQEIVRARGRNFEDVVNEIAQARELAETKGLSLDFSEPSTADANNPAAVEKQKSEPVRPDLAVIGGTK